MRSAVTMPLTTIGETIMKTFALVGQVGANFVWFATGEHDDMIAAMQDQIAQSDEEDHFMVLRVYASGNGAIGPDGELV